MPCKYQLSFALYPEKWYGDMGWAQVGAREALLFTLCSSGAGELRAVYIAIALPLPKGLAGQGMNLVVLLSCEHSFSISGGKRGLEQ